MADFWCTVGAGRTTWDFYPMGPHGKQSGNGHKTSYPSHQLRSIAPCLGGELAMFSQKSSLLQRHSTIISLGKSRSHGFLPCHQHDTTSRTRFNSAMIVEVTYGYQATQRDDAFLNLATHVMLETTSATS